MRVGLLTREYPPAVYGGAGTYVAHLVAHLRREIEVEVHCFGAHRPDAVAHAGCDALERVNPALHALSVSSTMAADLDHVDLVHSHTWYTSLAGHLAKLLTGAPLVVTAHTLEPLRPWKRVQLGSAYEISQWMERCALLAADAIIAVSVSMRTDVLRTHPEVDPARVHVIRTGVDSSLFHPDTGTDAICRYGIDGDRPTVVFAGRATEQKGIGHVLAAADRFDPTAQLVLCVWAADTPAILDQVRAGAHALSTRRPVVLVEQPLPPADLRQILSQATVVVSPSIYEPLGLINLEAMACGTAVVATAVGGIPEVVVHGRTGLLVSPAGTVVGLRGALADAVNRLLGNAALARAMGQQGRIRAINRFSWSAVASGTTRVYESVLGPG